MRHFFVVWVFFLGLMTNNFAKASTYSDLSSLKDDKAHMLISATLMVDQDMAQNPDIPINFRASWQEYDPKRLKAFYDGSLHILHPKVLLKDWSALTDEDKKGIPANKLYRPMSGQGILKLSEREKKRPKLPPRRGLKKLNIVGVSQFSENQLKNMVKKIRQEKGAKIGITVFDQRQEAHGHLEGRKITHLSQIDQSPLYEDRIYSLPFCLSGLADASCRGLDGFGAEAIEGSLIKVIAEKGQVTLCQITKKEGGINKNAFYEHFIVKDVYSEEYLCAEKVKVGYARIPVTDHSTFDDKTGSEYQRMIRAIPSESVVKIYHCEEGKGRTTMGMIIDDFLVNGRKYIDKLRFIDYILRHYLLGGSNLLRPIDSASINMSWKEKLAFNRAKNLALFWDHVIAKDIKIRQFYHMEINDRRQSLHERSISQCLSFRRRLCSDETSNSLNINDDEEEEEDKRVVKVHGFIETEILK